MDRVRAIIVDDEAPARKRIAELLERHSNIDIVGQYDCGNDAVLAIQHETPDILFLDIQMPELDGFQVLEQVGPDTVPVTVFVTAYDQHALKAFEVHALDYLLKPFSDERFELMLQRALRQLQTRESEAFSAKLVNVLERYRSTLSVPHSNGGDIEGEELGFLDRIAIKNAGRVSFVPVEEIDRCEAAGVYVRLYVGGKYHLLRETLANLEKRLDPKRFVRIHRSSIVAIDRIQELLRDKNSRYSVLLKDGTNLRLSQSYKVLLQKALGQKL